MGISTKAVSAVLIAPIVMIALAGCMQQPNKQSEPLPSETSASPAVMTEEQAVHAAQQAYTEYLAMSDLIAQEGGVNPERLLPYVSQANFESELKAFRAINDNFQHLNGQTAFDSLHVQKINGDEIKTYLCLDVTNAKLTNQDDSVVEVPAARWPLVVSFVRGENAQFIVSGSETWTGTNFC